MTFHRVYPESRREPRRVCRRAAVSSPSHSAFPFLPSAFCLSYLSPLPSLTYALLCATRPSQPLSHQSLPHSFSCNGGCAPGNSPSPPVLRRFFQVTYTLSSFLSHSSKNYRGVGGYKVRNHNVGLARPLQFTPSRLLLFSITYKLPNLQALCSDNVATVPGGRGSPFSFFRPRLRVSARGKASLPLLSGSIAIPPEHVRSCGKVRP